MWMDKENLFDEARLLTVTGPSTNIIDFGSDRDVGVGEPMDLVVIVPGTVALTAGGAATLVIALQTAIDAAFTTPIILYQTSPIPVAEGVPGAYLVRHTLPQGIKRYARLQYTVATGPFLTGALTAFLTKDYQAHKAYPSAYSLP